MAGRMGSTNAAPRSRPKKSGQSCVTHYRGIDAHAVGTRSHSFDTVGGVRRQSWVRQSQSVVPVRGYSSRKSVELAYSLEFRIVCRVNPFHAQGVILKP